MSLVIGLTGGIATGKSTISDMFKNHNIPVIDSDIIARNVVDINKPAYEKIVKEFGPEILLCTGHINRKKLGEIIFNDDSKRELLNSIVHPEVRKEVVEEINKYITLGNKIIVIDVPLLYESKFDDLCDFVVVVFTDKKTQYERLMKRDNVSKEEAKKRIDAQMSMHEKLQLADFKIDNSLSILETRKQFEMLLRKLKDRI